jgi:hypothetical protein
MKKIKILILTIIIILVLGGIVFIYWLKNTQNIQKEVLIHQKENFEREIQTKLSNFHPYKVNDCEIIMREKDLDYSLCCLNSENLIYQCDKTSFSPGEYIGLQVNLQKLAKNFPSYYACFLSDLPVRETVYPAKYGNPTNPPFFCSKLFEQRDYHHLALSGFILDKPGQYTIMRIWLFDGSLPADFDFQNNLEKGLKVFDLAGEIK